MRRVHSNFFRAQNRGGNGKVSTAKRRWQRKEKVVVAELARFKVRTLLNDLIQPRHGRAKVSSGYVQIRLYSQKRAPEFWTSDTAREKDKGAR